MQMRAFRPLQKKQRKLAKAQLPCSGQLVLVPQLQAHFRRSFLCILLLSHTADAAAADSPFASGPLEPAMAAGAGSQPGQAAGQGQQHQVLNASQGRENTHWTSAEEINLIVVSFGLLLVYK